MFKLIITKYGNQVSIILNNKYKLFLSHRFVNAVFQQVIDNYNSNLRKIPLIYKGK